MVRVVNYIVTMVVVVVVMVVMVMVMVMRSHDWRV